MICELKIQHIFGIITESVLPITRKILIDLYNRLYAKLQSIVLCRLIESIDKLVTYCTGIFSGSINMIFELDSQLIIANSAQKSKGEVSYAPTHGFSSSFTW